MSRETKIAKRVVAGLPPNKAEFLKQVRGFQDASNSLQRVIDLWENYWSYGAASDEVLQDMLKTCGVLAKDVKKIKRDLDRKIDEWSKLVK